MSARLFIAASLLACSSGLSVTEAASGGGVVESTPVGLPPSSSGGPPNVCPESQPASGLGCIAPDGTACEYGHDLDPQCNVRYRCDAMDGWTLVKGKSCGQRCPDSHTEIEAGTYCVDTTMGCSYVQGTCACIGDGDAGADQVGVWRCAPRPDEHCPAQRPAVGSDCVHPMTCDYGSAILGKNLVFQCVDSQWRGTPQLFAPSP